jgi:hypothetical protein
MFEEEWEWAKGGKLPGSCKCRLILTLFFLLCNDEQLEVSATSHIDARAVGKMSDANASIFGSCGGMFHQLHVVLFVPMLYSLLEVQAKEKFTRISRSMIPTRTAC